MPFSSSIKLLENIILIVAKIKKDNEEMNQKIIQEINIFYKNLEKTNQEIILYIDKLKSFQQLSPTTHEVPDLKSRCDKLLQHINEMNDLLNTIKNNNNNLLLKREFYKKNWYLCVERYTKQMFLDEMQELNTMIDSKMKLLDNEFDDIEKLMNIYDTQITNLKFKFIPLRRLWISNKWDQDANQDSQRVTISSFIQEVQCLESIEYRPWNGVINDKHYEKMKQFLNNMIQVGKTEKQLNAIGLGKSCGTYFLDNSLMANLTNLPSEKLKWDNLSDMVLYFSILPIDKPIDDKITVEIMNKWDKANYKIQPIIYNAFVIKDNITYVITNKQTGSCSFDDIDEMKLSLFPVDMSINNLDYVWEYGGDVCEFARKEYEGNYYFYYPEMAYDRDNKDDYSLHYNIHTDIWYLSRFNYNNDTGDGYSGIFVRKTFNKKWYHREQDTEDEYSGLFDYKIEDYYDILQSCDGTKILKCDLNIVFKQYDPS
jgi:hypothetical protein